MEKNVKEGHFREDLYYRINVITLNLPPLRERKQDIAVLAEYFLQVKCSNLGRELVSLSSEAIQALEKYNWPGNVRQLENLLERALVFCDGSELKVEDLNLPFNEKVKTYYSLEEKIDDDKSLKSEEKMIIKSTLEKNNWNISKSAKRLGIARATLYRKMDNYGLR